MIREPFNPERVMGDGGLRHEGVDPLTESLMEKVIGAAIEVHKVLGPGYSESVYEHALSVELTRRGILHVRQAGFILDYKGETVGEGRMDIFVDSRLVVELKSVEAISKTHEAQVVSYLKANQKRLALLINFNVARLKDGLKRIIH